MYRSSELKGSKVSSAGCVWRDKNNFAIILISQVQKGEEGEMCKERQLQL